MPCSSSVYWYVETFYQRLTVITLTILKSMIDTIMDSSCKVYVALFRILNYHISNFTLKSNYLNRIFCYKNVMGDS